MHQFKDKLASFAKKDCSSEAKEYFLAVMDKFEFEKTLALEDQY